MSRVQLLLVSVLHHHCVAAHVLSASTSLLTQHDVPPAGHLISSVLPIPQMTRLCLGLALTATLWPAESDTSCSGTEGDEPDQLPVRTDAYLQPPSQPAGLGGGVKPLTAVISVSGLPKGALVEIQPLACRWDAHQVRSCVLSSRLSAVVTPAHE